MTISPDLTPSDEELKPGLSRLLNSLNPKEGDSTFLVLKSHLLLEELLRDFISKQTRHPAALQESRLTFLQVLKLSQAFATTLEPADWRWQALITLNRLRNSLAHEFESESIKALIKNIVNTVGSKIGGDFPRIDQVFQDEEADAVNHAIFGLAVTGLYSSLAVRLGFDANFRFIAERKRAEEIWAAFEMRKAATQSDETALLNDSTAPKPSPAA